MLIFGWSPTRSTDGSLPAHGRRRAAQRAAWLLWLALAGCALDPGTVAEDAFDSTDSELVDTRTGTVALRPVLRCVEPIQGGQLRAHWGYVNASSKAVKRPLCDRNQFSPGGRDRGQPTLFLPGTHDDVFSVVFGATSALTWRLDGTAITASRKSRACTDIEDASSPEAGLPDTGCDAAVGDAGAPADAGDAGTDAAPGATAVALGLGHSCASFRDGRAKCWGGNDFGSLGLGDVAARGDEPGEMGDALPFLQFGAERSVRALAPGAYRTCALLDDGSIRCWGWNGQGALGLGDSENRFEVTPALPPVMLGSGRSAKAIASGFSHSCALLDDGSVKCWGGNYYNELGYPEHVLTRALGDDPGEMGDALPAVQLGRGRHALGLAAGFRATCAVLDDGSVKCWGSDRRNLGLGDFDWQGEMGDALPAVPLGTSQRAKAVTVGRLHACALLDDGTIKCWGSNLYGQLGLGDTETRGDDPGEMGDNLPRVPLGEGRTATAVVAGDEYTCALLDDASLKCWGRNGQGGLGLGDTNPRGDQPGEMGDALPPVQLGAERKVRAISAGSLHTCALLDDDGVKCWGWNVAGQLGLGDTADRGDGPAEMGDALQALAL